MESLGLRRRGAASQERKEEVKQEEEEEEEGWLDVAGEVLLPYLCAGLGMVAAGLLLDTVQSWPVFQAMPELFILVPALLGLKGNLEMTLASRLSTAAWLGSLDTSRGVAELALTQVGLGFITSNILNLPSPETAGVL